MFFYDLLLNGNAVPLHSIDDILDIARAHCHACVDVPPQGPRLVAVY